MRLLITFDRIPPLFLMLPVAAMTAIWIFASWRGPQSSPRVSWWHRFRLWLARLAMPRSDQPGSRNAQTSPAPPSQGLLGLGVGLACYFENHPDADQMLLNQLACLRRELYLDCGLVLPSLTVVQLRNLQPEEYSLHFGDLELARGSLSLDRWLLSFEQVPVGMEERAREVHPVTGRPCAWVEEHELGRLRPQGMNCQDPMAVFAHHLRHVARQNLPAFVTSEYCQQFLAQGLERSPQVRMFRRQLEENPGKLLALLQTVLALGGSLRDPGRVLYTAAIGFAQGEPVENLARRLLEQEQAGGKNEYSTPPCLSSALLYSYFWNEHLSSDLISRSDLNTLENLGQGMLEVQSLPPAILEQMWMDTLSHSEMFLLGRSAELGEQLHQMLQARSEGPGRLGRSEQTAVLLLSLNSDVSQGLLSRLIGQLPRTRAEELVQAMGRFGYLLLQAPPGQAGRQLTELGFRERILQDFLDFATVRALPPADLSPAWLRLWLSEQRRWPLDALAYAVESYYFPCLDPTTRLRRALRHDFARLSQSLLEFARGATAPLAAKIRAPLALQALPMEVGQAVLGKLHERGIRLPGSAAAPVEVRQQCQWEFYLRVGSNLGSNPRVHG